MRSASLITLHLLQGSVVVVAIGATVLVALGVKALLSLPRPRPVYVPIRDLMGERQ